MSEKGINFSELSIHEGPELSPGFLLWSVSTAWRRSIENILSAIGLTHPQFVILARLAWLTRNGEQVKQMDVGKMAGQDPNTTSQIIRGLEKRGLLVRVPSQDGRAKNPVLTEMGKEAVSKALPKVESGNEAFFHPLSLEEIETLTGLFQKLSKTNAAD